jgi:hypothetical protein
LVQWVNASPECPTSVFWWTKNHICLKSWHSEWYI